MRSLILLIAGLISLNGLLAQSAKADSLETLLAIHPQLDTVRVNLLNSLAEEIRRLDRKKLDSVVQEALSLTRKLDFKKGEGFALLFKGHYYFDGLDYSEALRHYNNGLEVFESIRDKGGIATVLRARARVYLNEGQYPKSLDDNLAAIKLAEEAGDIKLVINLKSDAGYLFNMIGDDEKATPYYTDALNQSIKINYKQGMAAAYNAMGKTYKTQGNYIKALDAYKKGLAISEELKTQANIAVAFGNIGDVYERMGNYPEALLNVNRFMTYYSSRPNSEDRLSWGSWLLGRVLLHTGYADSGLYYGKRSLELALKANDGLYLREITQLIGQAAAKLNKYDTAYKYALLSAQYKDSLTGEAITRKTAMLQANYELNKKQNEIELQKEKNRKERAFLFMVLGGLVSAIVLAIILFRNNRHKQKANLLLQKQKKEIDKKAHELSVQKDELQQSYSNVESLSEIGRKISSSLSVETIIGTVYDNVNSVMDASVFGIGIYHEETKKIEFPATYENGVALPAYSNSIYDENRFAGLSFISGKEIVMGDLEKEYQNFLQQLPIPKQGSQPVSLIYLPLKVKEKILGVITVQSFQKNAYSDYHLYMLRNIAIYTAIALENAESYKKLNQTVDSLKQTQSQLIQSEKMASLGELTAGIAHEIQNPLNFVNNFSEVNTELIDELEEEATKGNVDQVRSIARDIRENEQKIIHHGKRADAIVKSMLQHSRSSTGKKELIDLNSLADEYLRLAYHGLRARDKSFNASFKTNFDNSIDKVSVIPQDIGRVLVNLINNAFYAVGEKYKQSKNGYEPTVTVTTKKIGDRIELKVIDNGDGIPQKVRDKIFQPFFTTKPTGQGTGLGLSLSYDIVKAHGGELKVETMEGEGSEFIIYLAINTN